MQQIFLSYARRDHAWMQRVRGAVVEAGFVPWTDEHLIAGAPDWAREIAGAIDASEAVVAVMTPAAKDSHWVANEIQYAKEHSVPIVPVLVDGTARSSIPITLIGYQHIDMRIGGAHGRLVQTLRELGQTGQREDQARPLPPPPLPPPPPPPPPPAVVVSRPATPAASGASRSFASAAAGPIAPAVPQARPRLGSTRPRLDRLVTWLGAQLGSAGQVQPAGDAGGSTDVLRRRFLAVFVDAMVVGAITLAVTAPLRLVWDADQPASDPVCDRRTEAADCDEPSSPVDSVEVGVFYTVFIGLSVGTQLRWGTTLGKRLTGLRVVDVEGQPVGRHRVLVRTAMLFFDLGCFGWLLVAVSDNHRRLGDIVAGTFVVGTLKA